MFQTTHVVVSDSPRILAARAACEAVDAAQPHGMGESLFSTFLRVGLYADDFRAQALEVRLAMLEGGKAAKATGADDGPFISAYFAVVGAFC